MEIVCVQSFFGFGQSAEIDIILDGAATRRTAEVKTEDGKKERLFLFFDGESLSGKVNPCLLQIFSAQILRFLLLLLYLQVNITLKRPGYKLEHQGIKIEFLGQIELYYDRGNHHEFTSLVKELARPGELHHNTSYDFDFNQVEKPYEVYTGTNVKLR